MSVIVVHQQKKIIVRSGTSASSTTPLGSPTNPVASASATRPSLPVVYWQTPTQPTNWVPGDIWINNS